MTDHGPFGRLQRRGGGRTVAAIGTLVPAVAGVAFPALTRLMAADTEAAQGSQLTSGPGPLTDCGGTRA
jgi:hypothetical protein